VSEYKETSTNHNRDNLKQFNWFIMATPEDKVEEKQSLLAGEEKPVQKKADDKDGTR